MFNLHQATTRIIIIVVLMIMPFLVLFAQEDKGVFDCATVTNYNQLSGMPQNSVNDFCFDKLGYLWIATWGGLSRFDGKHFKNDFGYNGSFSTKVRVMHFFKKNLDTIYAMTIDKKLFVVANGNVVNYEAYAVTKHGVLLQNAQASVPALQGINDSNFVDYCHKNDWSIQFACLGFKNDNNSFGILGKELKVYFNQGLPRAVSLPEHNIRTEHRYWDIYILENNVVVFNNKTGYLDVYTTNGKIEHFLLPIQNKLPWKVYPGIDNHSLFASNNNTLFEITISPSENQVAFTKMLDNFSDSINSRAIYNLNNKYLVIASGSQGFYLYHKNNVQTFMAPAKDMIANYFYAQALMPDNKTILTGINLLFDKNGFKEVSKALNPTTNPMNYAFLNRAIYKDHSGYYWYMQQLPDSLNSFALMKATYPGGPDAVKIQQLVTPVRSFFEDSKNNIWFNNYGRFGYLKKGTTKYVPLVLDTGNNFYVTQNILCYTGDNFGRIVIGTLHGVFLFDPGHPAIMPQKYLLDSTEIHYLSFNKQTGALWIGTYGKGVWVLKKTGELLQLPMDKEGNMSIVHYAVSDKYNRVWFSTNNGLYVTTQKNLDDFEAKRSVEVYYYRFSTYDGLTTNEFNGGCQLPMILQPDGTLTISSVAGLARINTIDAAIDFSGKSLQTEIIHGNKILSAAVRNLDIDAGDNSDVIIDVLAPDWSPEYNIQLQYRIIKMEDKGGPVWQDVNEQHRVSLPFLGSGDYEMQFRKRTGLNNGDFIYHTVTIHKKPYWYQTIFIYPIVLIILVTLGYLLYLWRMLTLRRKNKILSDKIISATADLKDKNEELVKTIETRDNLITLFNHDLSTPLFYINRLAKSLADEDDIKEPYASAVQLLADSTQDLEELMNEMLLWIQMQQKNSTIQLVNEPVNLIELLERNFDLFRHRLKQNNLITRLLVPFEATIFVDRRVFNSILYNLITNAIKYTQNGVIQIETAKDKPGDDDVYLLVRSKSNSSVISDRQGRGSYKEINDIIKSNKPPVANEQARQIGLQLVKSFATMLDIEVSFDSTVADTFTVKISGLNFLRH